jgi:hypothetical protein
MELNLNRLSDDAIHVSGFGGEDGRSLPATFLKIVPVLP